MFGMGANGEGGSKCPHGVQWKPGAIELDCKKCREEAEVEKARRDAELSKHVAIRHAEDEANCSPLIEADWVSEVEDYDYETGRETWVTREEFLAGFKDRNQPVFDRRDNIVRSAMGSGGMRHEWR